MITDDIATYLANNGHGIAGKTVFSESMPASVKDGLVVTSQTKIARHPYVGCLRTGSIQVIARTTDDGKGPFRDPRTVLEGVINTLSGEGLQIGSTKFLIIRAAHEPFMFPVSGNVTEAVVEFDVTYTQ